MPAPTGITRNRLHFYLDTRDWYITVIFHRASDCSSSGWGEREGVVWVSAVGNLLPIINPVIITILIVGICAVPEFFKVRKAIVIGVSCTVVREISEVGDLPIISHPV